MSKYQFVFKHDRAGRLIDTQEFTDIGFPLDKFDAAVIEELMHEAGESTRIDGDQLVIRHLYVERRLRPLNLFVREADRSAAEAAVLDYGQALRDLAHANIFPGDLLIKNFGVTRHGRCIFYDYDELCLVTDCNFREVPESPFDEDEMRPRPWFHVNANDVFPEEFMRFLALDEGLKQTFMSRHADLLSVEFWRGVQQLHIAAEGSDRRAALHPGQPRPRARPAFS
jgi:isocitrate dehydrogenase kinase/phosphatase